MGRIRLAVPEDGVRLAEIYRPAVEETGVSFESVAPDGAEMSRRIVAVLERAPWLVAEEDGVVTGYTYASRHRERPAYAWTVEVSIYIDGTRHRGGTGRRLYQTLFDILTLQGYQGAYAGVLQPNPASSNFHRAMGFAEIGMYRNIGFKNGRWWDTVWYQRALGEYPVPPQPVQLLPALRDTPQLEHLIAERHWS